MALEKTVTTVHGLKAIDAYHRVENLRLPTKSSMVFSVRSYTDITKPFFSEQEIEGAYNLNEENPIKQAYEYLKQNEFIDSKDI